MTCPNCHTDNLRRVTPSGKAPRPPEDVRYWCGKCLKAFDEDRDLIGRLQKVST